MAFNGLGTTQLITNSLIAEDVSPLVRTLMPKESPFTDWLFEGGTVQATATKHEFVMDYLLPNYVVNSTAVASATANTAFQVNGLGLALTVGTLLENETAAPELMQVVSIVGANSIVVSRNYDGAATGSAAAGQQFYVRGMAAIEGQDHSGAHTARLGTRTANTVGYFNIELAASGTQLAINQLGNDAYADAERKALIDAAHQLEKEILRGKFNGANSLASATTTRTMLGIRPQLTTINSQITASSFSANPHLYIGNAWEQMYQQGASPTESWGLVCGRTFYRDVNNLNDTFVVDSNSVEAFKRVVRTYTGPFGTAEIFVSRALPATELLIVPRERVRPVQLRPWQRMDMARSGDNQKSAIIGEYSVEVHHPAAMARLYV